MRPTTCFKTVVTMDGTPTAENMKRARWARKTRRARFRLEVPAKLAQAKANPRSAVGRSQTHPSPRMVMCSKNPVTARGKCRMAEAIIPSQVKPVTSTRRIAAANAPPPGMRSRGAALALAIRVARRRTKPRRTNRARPCPFPRNAKRGFDGKEDFSRVASTAIGIDPDVHVAAPVQVDAEHTAEEVRCAADRGEALGEFTLLADVHESRAAARKRKEPRCIGPVREMKIGAGQEDEARLVETGRRESLRHAGRFRHQGHEARRQGQGLKPRNRESIDADKQQ